MIRDPGPIHNLGYSVTSRDLPINEGDKEGISHNSGVISKALNSHPIIRFFATTAATIGGTFVASKLTKSGGIKLAKHLQKRSETSPIATRLIKSVTEIRRELDELQGVARQIDGDDPYSKLIFQQDGKYTTGYQGMKSERFGYRFLNDQEKRQAGFGLTREPAGVWSWREELQVRLVRAGRRMPYELPALYGAQRGLTDPIFGRREEGERKVKWYNPADVMADFTKQSLSNIATMILPFEFAGAATSAGRSSLQTLRYSLNDMANLTPRQAKFHNAFVDLSEVLSEVGHDFATLTNKFLKVSAQTSGGFSSAVDVYKTEGQRGFVQNLHNLRQGITAAEQQAVARQASRDEIKKVKFETLIKGFKGTSTGPNGLKTTENYNSILDIVPSFRGVRAAYEAGAKEFKLLGKAYDAMENSIAFNKVLSQMTSVDRSFQANTLEGAIRKIQSQHSSRLSSLATGLTVLGGGGPGDKAFTSSDFYRGRQQDAFKGVLTQQLIARGIDKKQAGQFVDYLNVRAPRSNMNASNIITIGKNKIIQDGDTAIDIEDDFFSKILKRYRGIKGGKTLSEALEKSGSLNNTPQSSSQVLNNAVKDARDIFASREFQKNLNLNIKKNWNTFYSDHLSTIGGSLLKPKKAQYQDFVGPLTLSKQEFLQRKTAEVLGIKLLDDSGREVSNNIVNNALRKQGFDPTKFTDLRAFLIKNKQMTSGIFNGGFNLFGLQPLTIDEARNAGRFNYLGESERKTINDLAVRMAVNDPVSKSIGFSKLDGVYKTKAGEILDFSAIKTTFKDTADFFMGQFKIPVLGFNPFDLFGYRSFAEMAKRSPIQYVSSRSAQPFLNKGTSEKDFYLWYKTKGSRGKVMGFETDSLADKVYGESLPGTYRPIPTASSDLLTRQTRLASGMSGETTDEINRTSGSRFLNKILGGEQRALKFKRAMSMAPDQPNSLFGLAKRFSGRKTDIQNKSVIAKLVAGEEIDYTIGGASTRIKLNSSTMRVVDSSGKAIDEFNQSDILKAYESLRKQSFQYGTNPVVMRQLEELHPELFTMGGKRVSSMSSGQEMAEFAQGLLRGQKLLGLELKGLGVDPQFLTTSGSRLQYLLNNGNLNAISQMSQKSPTITTRLDQLRNEIFRYISQVNQVKLGASNQGEVFIQIQKAIDDLVKIGKISPSQRTEAQAAALGTMFNISAFTTFKHGLTGQQNMLAAAKQMLTTVRSSTETKRLLEPFSSGRISEVNSSGIQTKFSPITTPLKRKFGIAQHQTDDLTVDPLGTGQSVTLVPTFGTVFGNDPMGAIKSAIGLTTYSDPQSFSTGSMPMSHSVERLNRYFGTLGMQLDTSDFGGPLSLYTKGMIGKRVLPIYAAGTTALTVDRTLGGMTSEEDARGEKVYRPLVLGQVAKAAVEGQALMSGIMPGGMNYQDKREQLVEGEVPIRQGRFWPLGNTPFKGGKIMYHRPSWYQKLQGGAGFTSDLYGSPMEKFLFYNDISPLRPLDPYRFERKHYEDRPYPVTGEYFSGPFGPLTPFLNMTVGKILKPQKMMHEQEVAAGLASYAPAGQSGAYDTLAYAPQTLSRVTSGVSGSMGFGGAVQSPRGQSGYAAPIANYNTQMASMAGAMNTAGMATANTIGNINQSYLNAAYGPPKVSGVMQPRVVGAGSPLKPSHLNYQLTEFGYKMQEMAGIYGFAFGTFREKFGFGQSDFEPQRSVLQSAQKAYGTTRAFWDLNLGGLGDVPIPSREAIGNIEFSEIVRRFIPKERTGVDYINPIQNLMGQQYPFLPGPEYYTDFTRGDPFSKIQEGEIRLPGVGYERFNKLYPDQTGEYGLINQLDILGDVAPYSKQFKNVNTMIDKQPLTAEERIRVAEIRNQVEQTTKKYEFSDYKYSDISTPENIKMATTQPFKFSMTRLGESIVHSDNFLIAKTIGKRSAVEDWERRNVYGTTFPEWSRPYESYIKPMLNKSTQENPISAAATLGFVGSMFGATPGAKLFGTTAGIMAGGGSSIFGNAYELITGDRFIPQERKKELALEEYTDILSYVKNTRLANMSKQSGDMASANQFRMAAKRTMYGADLYGSDVETLSLAVPKRKREHFKAMISAPVSEREKILSTSGRLERRLYEAAWGMKVEKRPELEDYFARHELPDASWEGWHPNTNIDAVKIKMGQSMGLEMSQMGYYPQQIKEANLVNPSYPNFNYNNDRQDVVYKLRSLMSGMGLSGSVNVSSNPFGSNNFNVSAGVR